MRKQTISKVILEDIEKQLGCSDIFNWLDTQAEILSLAGSSQHTQKTILTRELFAARSVIEVEEQDKLNQAACILPMERGYKIQYARGLPASKRRFAIAHEIGHTYFSIS